MFGGVQTAASDFGHWWHVIDEDEIRPVIEYLLERDAHELASGLNALHEACEKAGIKNDWMIVFLRRDHVRGPYFGDPGPPPDHIGYDCQGKLRPPKERPFAPRTKSCPVRSHHPDCTCDGAGGDR